MLTRELPFSPITTAPIYDISRYNAQMAQALQDKLFWAPHLTEHNLHTLLDYGCADATILAQAAQLLPFKRLIGYDIDPVMRDQAQRTLSAQPTPFYLIPSFHKLQQHLSDPEQSHTTVLLSSVLHEVHTYCSKPQIQDFWNLMLHGNAQTIVIRDMTLSAPLQQPTPPDLLQALETLLQDDHGTQMEWEYKWGPLSNLQSAMHFLLTYPYAHSSSWARELNENYFALHLDHLLAMVEDSPFTIAHLKHYPLPYFQQQWRRTLNLPVNYPTHLQLILKRK